MQTYEIVLLCVSICVYLCLFVQVFCEVAYKARNKDDLINGVEEFLDDLTVLPPSIWDPSTRLDPPEKTMSLVIKGLIQVTPYIYI